MSYVTANQTTQVRDSSGRIITLQAGSQYDNATWQPVSGQAASASPAAPASPAPASQPPVNLSASSSALRNALQTGQITAAQAKMFLTQELAQGYGATLVDGKPQFSNADAMNAFNAAMPSAVSGLFSNLTGIENGQQGTYDSSGNFIQTSTRSVQSNTTANGTKTQTTAMPAANSELPMSQQGYEITSTGLYHDPVKNTYYNSSYQPVDKSGSLLASSGAGSASNTPGMIPGTNIPTTGDPAYDAALKNTYDHTQSQLALGNAVNPDLQITPALTTQFLNEAHAQLDPQTQQLLTNKIADINAATKALTTQYQNEQGKSITSFNTDLATERESAGGAGTAFSGQRGLNENNLQLGENRTLSTLDSTYGNAIGSNLRTGAAALGAGIPGMTGSYADLLYPSITSSTVSLGGERGGSTSGNALDYSYNPTSYKYGSIGTNFDSQLLQNEAMNKQDYLNSAVNNSGRAFTSSNGTLSLT